MFYVKFMFRCRRGRKMPFLVVANGPASLTGKFWMYVVCLILWRWGYEPRLIWDWYQSSKLNVNKT